MTSTLEKARWETESSPMRQQLVPKKHENGDWGLL